MECQIFKWRKASEKLPPIKVPVILKDEDEVVYTDICYSSWDKRVLDYSWLEEVEFPNEEKIKEVANIRPFETPHWKGVSLGYIECYKYLKKIIFS